MDTYALDMVLTGMACSSDGDHSFRHSMTAYNAVEQYLLESDRAGPLARRQARDAHLENGIKMGTCILDGEADSIEYIEIGYEQLLCRGRIACHVCGRRSIQANILDHTAQPLVDRKNEFIWPSGECKRWRS